MMNSVSTGEGRTMSESNQDPSMATEDAYMSYSPTSSSKHLCYAHFHDKLGFKPTRVDMCTAFNKDVEKHLQSPSNKFLTRSANPEALKILVSEFLSEYGPKWWGQSRRGHLEEPDTHWGFLCPRDALRPDSRLVAVVESFFNFKAYMARKNDSRKSKANRLMKDIDFAAVTGRKADLIGHPEVSESSTANKRCAAHREAEDDEEDDEDAWNRSKRTRNRKRQRLSPQSEEWTEQNEALDGRPKQAKARPRRPAVFAASPMLHKHSKRADPPKSSPRRQPESKPNTPLASEGSATHSITPSATRTSPMAHARTRSAPIPLSSSPEPEQLRQKTARSRHRAPENTKQGPDSTAQEENVRIQEEPLSAKITGHIMLRVKADGAGVKARGPISIAFENHKTTERLFTSLISERRLKPEMQEKVSALTVTIDGKETCCRRDAPDDWTNICRELRKLWDKNPGLFKDRFEVDVMLHVDE